MVRSSRSFGVLAVVAALGACGGESKRSGAKIDGAGTGATTDAASAGQGSGDDSGTGFVGSGGAAGGHDARGGSGALGGVGALGGSGAMTGSSGLGGSDSGGAMNVPGCPPENIDQCDPGPNQTCDSTECTSGTPSPIGFDERGDGVLCKYSPDSAGPDFACIRGEWCQMDLKVCRCGPHPGCQQGEACTICTRGDCKGEYRCARDVACNEENLDSCAAEPGQTCPSNSLVCAEPVECPDMMQGAGATLCAYAPNGCCPAGHWCFDGRECRCGAHPGCSDGEECVLDYREFYACSAR